MKLRKKVKMKCTAVVTAYVSLDDRDNTIEDIEEIEDFDDIDDCEIISIIY